MTSPVNPEDFQKVQAVEYGTYIANQPIDQNGVRAYQYGDAVPVSNVLLYGYDKSGLVDKVSTSKAAAFSPAPSIDKV
jgi:hypothetical protein